MRYNNHNNHPKPMQSRMCEALRKAWLLIPIVMLCSCATSRPGSAMQHTIERKTYVIVGASSGLGRGVAEDLGRYKANVVLAARRTELLEQIATRIRNSGGTAQVVTTDISKQDEVE